MTQMYGLLVRCLTCFEVGTCQIVICVGVHDFQDDDALKAGNLLGPGQRRLGHMLALGLARAECRIDGR